MKISERKITKMKSLVRDVTENEGKKKQKPKKLTIYLIIYKHASERFSDSRQKFGRSFYVVSRQNKLVDIALISIKLRIILIKRKNNPLKISNSLHNSDRTSLI